MAYDLRHLGALLNLQKEGFEIEFRALLGNRTQEMRFERVAVG